MTDRAIQLLVSAEAASSFVKPEILAIEHETLVSWSKQDRFAPFRFDLFDIDRRREHTLSTEEERLLAMAEVRSPARRTSLPCFRTWILSTAR